MRAASILVLSTGLLIPAETIRGRVVDSATQLPVSNIRLWLDSHTEGTLDSQGYFEISNIAAGRHSLRATLDNDESTGVGLIVNLPSPPVKLELNAPASFSGSVISDTSGEPQPRAKLYLLRPHYSLQGKLRYVVIAETAADSEGRYRFDRVAAGSPHLLLVQPAGKLPKLAASSDPEARPAIPSRTFYPSALNVEDAQPLSLSAGEHRTGVDLRIQSTASLCVEGTITVAAAALSFRAVERLPLLPDGTSDADRILWSTPADGQFRACGFSPGNYLITGENSRAGVQLSASLTIGNGDLLDIKLAPRTPIDVSGTVKWEGLDRASDTTKILLGLTLLEQTRSYVGYPAWVTPAPGVTHFDFGRLRPGNYRFRVDRSPPGTYLKSLRADGIEVPHGVLSTDDGLASLAVVLGTDGGTLAVHATDRDGNPIPSAYLYLVSRAVSSESDFAARFTSTEIENGSARFNETLAPGRYLLIPSDVEPGSEVRRISKLWADRSRAVEVEIAPHTTVETFIQFR